jgi:hypothetical protein
VSATPVVAVPCEGRAPAYAALSVGESVGADTDFVALSQQAHAPEWRAQTAVAPLVYTRTHPSTTSMGG